LFDVSIHEDYYQGWDRGLMKWKSGGLDVSQCSALLLPTLRLI